MQSEEKKNSELSAYEIIMINLKIIGIFVGFIGTVLVGILAAILSAIM